MPRWHYEDLCIQAVPRWHYHCESLSILSELFLLSRIRFRLLETEQSIQRKRNSYSVGKGQNLIGGKELLMLQSFFSTKREEKENKNPRRALNLIWPALFALVIVLDGRWQLLLQLLHHSKATAVFKLRILIKCVAWLYFNLNLTVSADPGSTSQSFSLLSGMKMLKT